MALNTVFSQQPALAGSPPFKKFMSKLETTLALLACTLRKEYSLMVQSRTDEARSALARFDAINIEADRINNSVNTLAEQIMQWTRTPESAALHKFTLESGTGKAHIQPAS